MAYSDLKLNGAANTAMPLNPGRTTGTGSLHFLITPLEIRKLIYTTNAIESLNSTIRKFTKTKTVFPDDQSVMKAVYLAICNVQKKWVLPIRDWGMILNQFIIIFENRCKF